MRVQSGLRSSARSTVHPASVEQLPIALEAPQHRKGHLAREPGHVVVGESVAPQDVGEGDDATGLHDARTFGDEPRLVGDMAPGLLSDDHVEGCVVERHVERTAEMEAHAIVEADATREPPGRVDATLREIESDDGAADAVGEVARRSAHAAADIQHAVFRTDSGGGDQQIVGFETAEVVLVVETQFGRRDGLRIDPAIGQRPQDLRLVDRMRVVVADDRGGGVGMAVGWNGQGPPPARAGVVRTLRQGPEW
jgi:hypothetical protein